MLRSAIALPLRVLALLVVIVSVLACTQSARDKAIHATYDTTNAARAGFVAFDLAHQTSLVAANPDPAAARAAVDAWRAKRAHVVEVFEGTYRAIAAAAIISDDQSLSALVTAAAQLADELRALGVIK